MKRTILITGACGYLGSAICVDLARDCRIIAIDKRMPSQELRHAAPNVQWKLVDIADAINLNSVFLKNNGKKLNYELVRIVRRVIEKNNSLGRFDILFASEDGCTRHKDLFPIIRCVSEKKQLIKPIHIPPALTRIALFGKYYLNTILKKKTYERSWMINYVDHPLVVDTTNTRQTRKKSENPSCLRRQASRTI